MPVFVATALYRDATGVRSSSSVMLLEPIVVEMFHGVSGRIASDL